MRTSAAPGVGPRAQAANRPLSQLPPGDPSAINVPVGPTPTPVGGRAALLGAPGGAFPGPQVREPADRSGQHPPGLHHHGLGIGCPGVHQRRTGPGPGAEHFHRKGLHKLPSRQHTVSRWPSPSPAPSAANIIPSAGDTGLHRHPHPGDPAVGTDRDVSANDAACRPGAGPKPARRCPTTLPRNFPATSPQDGGFNCECGGPLDGPAVDDAFCSWFPQS